MREPTLAFGFFPGDFGRTGDPAVVRARFTLLAGRVDGVFGDLLMARQALQAARQRTI